MAEKRTFVVVMLALASGVAWAGAVPEAVSPGRIGGVARIAASCPSFSWGAVEGSQAYELVVYGAGSEGADGPILEVTIPGSALSWTPSLDECFAPGGRYVWFVRSVEKKKASEWSEGRVFEIAVGPTIAEVEQALRVLERFVRGSQGGAALGDETDGDELSNLEQRRADLPSSAEGPQPLAATGVEIAESSITIGGAEVVTTATDQDTLGGMSCADGELAKWHAGSSSWVCGAYAAGNQLFLDIDTFHVEEGEGSDLDADLLDGNDSTDFAQLALASAFTANPVSESVGGGPLFINPASGVKENNTLLGVAVAGNQRFRVDIEGDVELAGSINKGLTVLPEVSGGSGYASPNVVAGHPSNGVTVGVAGAGIGGGGGRKISDGTLSANLVTDDFGTVGGGLGNRAGDAAGTTSDRKFTTVGGGAGNTAAGASATIGGGSSNQATAALALVGGGGQNVASALGAAVTGGQLNSVSAEGGAVGGGDNNAVSDRWGVVAGGASNAAGDAAGTTSDAEFAAVAGGFSNEARAPHAAIGGGNDNLVSDRYGTVGGGSENRAGDNAGTTSDKTGATVAGGTQNIASGQGSAVGGGGGNTASGFLATISGGGTNSAEANAATVGGGQFNKARAENATISGGDNNEILDDGGSVGGGYLNYAGDLAGGSGDNPFATVAGGAQNEAKGGFGAVGGGSGNRVTDEYGTVGGGRNNRAGDGAGTTDDAPDATVGGGQSNIAAGGAATVGGGWSNQVFGPSAVVAGGHSNVAFAAHATIAGGELNTVQDAWGSIGGGQYNYAGDPSAGSEDDLYATVGGGTTNLAGAGRSTIAGGANNSAEGEAATIAGGEGNSIQADYGSIGGGRGNKVWDIYGTVAGGWNNEAGEDDGLDWNDGRATVSGGESNRARGHASTVAGGYNNSANGSYSFVAGGRNNTAIGDLSFAAGDWAEARHRRSFVWHASDTATVARSTADDQFFVRAAGGLRFEDPFGIEAAASFVKGVGSAGTGAVLEVVNRTDYGEVGWFSQTDVDNVQPVVKLVLPSGIPSNQLRNFLECEIPGGETPRKCHIDKYGTFHSGSDFAEALPALGERVGYEPGDVLVMAKDGSGVERVAEPYSPRVAGVYSTRPGVLGADKGGETRVDENDVPVAIVGIVPTKVSGENGSIAVGDLLVSSGTSGHAMKGTDRSRMQGAIVGKALEPFGGETGVIRVLVSLL